MNNQNNVQDEQKKIEEIAAALGTTVRELLESFGDPKHIIEEYKNGNLRILNE